MRILHDGQDPRGETRYVPAVRAALRREREKKAFPHVGAKCMCGIERSRQERATVSGRPLLLRESSGV